MKTLSEAIYNKFKDSPLGIHPEFYTDIGGRLFKGKAPQGAEMPYCVYYLISDVPEYSFTETFEEAQVQFSIFSETESSTEIEDAYGYLTDLFDNVDLEVEGYTTMRMQRLISNLIHIEADVESGAGAYWQYDVDYSILILKDAA